MQAVGGAWGTTPAELARAKSAAAGAAGAAPPPDHLVTMYDEQPKENITIDEFERLALDRLRRECRGPCGVALGGGGGGGGRA